MAEFKLNMDDEILDNYLNFCSEMNIDPYDLVIRFLQAVAKGGDAILEVPMHMPVDSLEAMMHEMEKVESADEKDKEEAIDSIMSKYLN